MKKCKICRILDIIISLMTIIILSPILIIIMIFLRLTNERKVFFLQERIGKFGKKFNVIKFVTMFENSPTIGSRSITIKDDPRILPFCNILRKLKINELPQLFNIIKGDMSLVGPRPLTEEVLSLYKSEKDKVVPGLTGLGSLIFSDEEALCPEGADPIEFYKKIIVPYKLEVELYFLKYNSFKLWLYIILLTIYVLIFKNKKWIWKIFKDLPPPPKEVQKF